METENVRIARRFAEVSLPARPMSWPSLSGKTSSITAPRRELPQVGRDLAEAVEFYQGCFSDLDLTADEVLEVGDRVVAYGTITGTHHGLWLKPASQRKNSEFR